MNTEPQSEVILGDSLEVLREMPDLSIDMAIADPPYGVQIMKSGRLIKEKGRTYNS